MPLKVLVVSGARSDWGLLTMPAHHLAAQLGVTVDVLATGQHLVPAFEGGLKEILDDGFSISAQVEIVLASDSGVGITKAVSLAFAGFADAFSRLSPDLLLLLGDRYEIFAAASVAHILRIPIAHIGGGDVTNGAIDDAFRHAISKFAHLHFVTNEDAARRLRQLGEPSGRIHCVGSPGIDRLLAFPAVSRVAFFEAVVMSSTKRNLLVTYHPETATGRSIEDLTSILSALAELDPQIGLIFTGVNADVLGRQLEAEIKRFCEGRRNAVYHNSLGGRLFRAALQHCDAIVGNSSAGLYEAPSFGIPTVNIGLRQSGRLKARSVLDCAPEKWAILSSIEEALRLDCRGVENPYGDGRASERIAAIIAGVDRPRDLLAKNFVDLVN